MYIGYRTDYIWDQGYRACNEDSLTIISIVADKHRYLLAMVADGIGGLEAGEVASSHAVRQMRTAFEKITQSRKNISIQELKRLAKKCMFEVHLSVHEYARVHEISLGTTVTMVIFKDNHGFVLHWGDSHLYRIKNGKTCNLVRDHVDCNKRLVCAIGCGQFHRGYARRIYLDRDCVYVLCTDGVYRRGEKHMSVILSNGEGSGMDTTLNKLVKLARDEGEKDNMAAITIARRSGRNE